RGRHTATGSDHADRELFDGPGLWAGHSHPSTVSESVSDRSRPSRVTCPACLPGQSAVPSLLPAKPCSRLCGRQISSPLDFTASDEAVIGTSSTGPYTAAEVDTCQLRVIPAPSVTPVAGSM